MNEMAARIQDHTTGAMRFRARTTQAKVKSQLEFKVGVRTVVCSRPLDKGANEYTLSKFHKTPCFIWGYWVELLIEIQVVT